MSGLRRILAIPAFVALLFAAHPALAMPWLAGAAIVSALVTAVVSAAVSFGLSFIVSAIFKKPSAGLKSPGGATDRNTFVDSKANLKETAGPWRVVYGETRVGNNMLFAHASSRKHMHLVLGVTHHEIDMWVAVQIGDETHYTQEALAADLVPDGAYVLDASGYTTAGFTFVNGPSLIRFKFHRGEPGQAADADLVAEVFNADLVAGTDNYEGIAYAYARLEHGPLGEQMPLFADGLPTFTFVIRGKKCLDPRDGVIRWTNNAALCAYDYMIDPLIGPKIDPANIYTAEVEAAADICEEQVVVGEGPATQDRYTCNGAFTLEAEPQATLDKILGSMRGRTPHDGDKWRMLAGAFYAPVGTLTQDDFREGPTINTVLSRRERFNSTKGTFIGYQNNWNETDFPPYSNPAWVEDDDGEVWDDLQLTFTNDAAMAQRLARLELELARRELTLTLHCKMPAWVYQAGDNLEIEHDVYTYLNDKIFEVQEVRLTVDPESGSGVELDVIETSAEAYFWDGSEEIPSTPNGPGGENPDLTTVDPVTNLTATEEVYSSAAGSGVKSRLIIEWDAPVDELIGGYQPEYRLQAGGDWIVLPRVAPGVEEVRIEDIAVGDYYVRVATVNIRGVLSTYVQIGVTVSGDTSPPEDVTGFIQVAGISGFSNFHWNGSIDQRVRDGGATIIKYQAVTTGATWAAAGFTYVGDGIVQDAVLQTQIGTYLIKFQTANGVQSVNAATIVISTLEQPTVGIGIVNGLPATDLWEGQIVYDEATEKLWRYVVGTGWTTAVPTTDLTGQVTNSQIADMAATKLTGTITTTQITDDAVTTPKLAAGSVVTAKIAAGSITAEKMIIGSFDNHVANPNFVNGLTNWGQLSGTYDTWISTMPTDISLLTGTGGYAGSQHVLQFAATYDFTSDGPLYNSSFFAVTAGEKYLLRTATQRITGGGTHTRDLTIELQFFRYDTTTSAWVFVTPTDPAYTQALDTDPANTWVVRDSNTYHAADNITVPATATRARVAVYNEAGGSVGGLYWLGLVSVFKRNPAALIVDGGIIAQTIATDAVTTNKVQAGAITSAKISVSQLSAISADVGSLTAGTITGLTIRTGSGTTRVEISSSGSYPNAITAYVSGTAVATFGGTVANGDGFIQVAGNFSLIYPARFVNTSTTGGGSATGGGAAFIKSEGGWSLQVDQSTTSAGTGNRTVAARITNIGAGGGGLEIGASAGDAGFAAYAFAGTYTPFTGSHDSLMDKTAPVPEVGDLLVTVDTVAVTISDTMPVVALSSEARQPAICGAFLNRRPADPDKPPSAMMEDLTEYREVNGVWMDVYPPVPEWGPLTGLYDVVFFNGVGEGGINACNQGGDIEPGDLLCSSSVPGKVMRQGDDVVHSYTVGKAMGRTTFSGPDDFKMIGVFYTSG